MSWSYTRRSSSVYSKQIITSREISRGSTLTNNPGRGVTLTMARIRDQCWIPTLRKLVKRIIKRRYGCERFNISHYPKPSQGLIPTDRIKQDLPFSVIGTDYAGPFLCKTKGNRDIKVYLLLFNCSLTRAVHLEILPNQTTQELIQALK